jgi:hypothetical protein
MDTQKQLNVPLQANVEHYLARNERLAAAASCFLSWKASTIHALEAAAANEKRLRKWERSFELQSHAKVYAKILALWRGNAGEARRKKAAFARLMERGKWGEGNLLACCLAKWRELAVENLWETRKTRAQDRMARKLVGLSEAFGLLDVLGIWRKCVERSRAERAAAMHAKLEAGSRSVMGALFLRGEGKG